jgi:hypothetical protein
MELLLANSKQKRSTRFYRRNEAEVMQSLGLTPTKNSGAGWIEKEDGYNDYLIAQLKSTDAESIRVALEDIHKLEYNANVAHKIPLFVIQFLKTNELFILSKPADFPSITEYINTGKCNVVQPVEIAIEEHNIKVKVANSIKSSAESRQKFWEDKSKQWQKK